MALILTKEEKNALIKQNPKVRYQYFIKRIADSEELFSVGDDDGLDMIVLKDREAILLWSHIEYVESFKEKNKEFNESRIVAMSIYDFKEEYIEFIEQENLLLNIFPIDDYSGFVVTMSEFLRDLEMELSKYR
jgi:hypothetical protein